MTTHTDHQERILAACVDLLRIEQGVTATPATALSDAAIWPLMKPYLRAWSFRRVDLEAQQLVEEGDAIHGE